VHQDLVPGFVLRRPAGGHLPVPLVGAAELRINIDDHAPITEELVADDLADRKLGEDGIHRVIDRSRMQAAATPITGAR
jgi:hypothetical protein